jgi:hypothetical protein
MKISNTFVVVVVAFVIYKFIIYFFVLGLFKEKKKEKTYMFSLMENKCFNQYSVGKVNLYAVHKFNFKNAKLKKKAHSVANLIEKCDLKFYFSTLLIIVWADPRKYIFA